MEVIEDLLDLAGIGRDRLRLRWVSAAEGQLFTQYVTEFSELTRKLGPFDHEKYRTQLEAIEQTLSSPRIRWILGLTKQLTEHGNVYNERLNIEEYKALLQSASKEEYEKALIEEVIKKTSHSVREIAREVSLPIHTVSLRLNELERHGQAELAGYDGSTPKFIGLAA